MQSKDSILPHPPPPLPMHFIGREEGVRKSKYKETYSCHLYPPLQLGLACVARSRFDFQAARDVYRRSVAVLKQFPNVEVIAPDDLILDNPDHPTPRLDQAGDQRFPASPGGCAHCSERHLYDGRSSAGLGRQFQCADQFCGHRWNRTGRADVCV